MLTYLSPPFRSIDFPERGFSLKGGALRLFRCGRGHCWQGVVQITDAPFFVIKRPPISRRQLNLMLPSKVGNRRKYGGTTTRHGFRKGDYVKAVKAGITYQGWCSGDTAKQVSVSDISWKRIAQFTASKVRLLRRSTGLICKHERSKTTI